jgi:hypothetical protein
MHFARTQFTATLLPNGKVLVTGGLNSGISGTMLASAELYDPNTGTWSMTGSMSTGRMANSAVLLDDGQVLVVGGTDLAGEDLYNPATGEFIPTGSIHGGGYPVGVLLNDGRVYYPGDSFQGFPSLLYWP